MAVRIPVLLLWASLASCVAGPTVPPSVVPQRMVLVYERAEDVATRFESVGRVARGGAEADSMAAVVTELRECARALGADAIVVTRVDRAADDDGCRVTVAADAIRWTAPNRCPPD